MTQEFGECVAEEDKEQDIKHLCGKHIKQKIRRKQKVSKKPKESWGI